MRMIQKTNTDNESRSWSESRYISYSSSGLGFCSWAWSESWSGSW